MFMTEEHAFFVFAVVALIAAIFATSALG